MADLFHEKVINVPIEEEVKNHISIIQ